MKGILLFTAFVSTVFLPAGIFSVKDRNHDSVQVSNLPTRGLCAHRGAMDTHPENTLTAFRAAIDHGAHMIEFDVRLTKDNKLVLMHDETVDRTTDGQGNVEEMMFDEIRKLDAGIWMGSNFKGEQVPTLSEALAMMPTNIWLNVHVKATSGIGTAVATEILKQNRQHQAFIACSHDVALEAKSVSPEIMICNMDRQSSDWDYVNLTIEQGAEFIQLKGDISDEYQTLTKHLHEKGIRINYFGTDDQDEIIRLFENGVQFPLVNNIVESIKISTELGIAPLEAVYAEK